MSNLLTVYDNLNRASVGFDRLFDRLSQAATTTATSYPPYNVVKHSETEYEVQIAVAGFREDELDVTLHNGELTITGESVDREEDTNINFLYRGIAKRKFTRVFNIADGVEVKGASVKNGLLSVTLEHHVPEELKPKKIAINFQG